jgi:hypothetical protein
MYKATGTYLDENAAAWNGIVANVDARALLGVKITAIDDKITAQEAALSGYTGNKRIQRTALETQILLVAGGTAAYARATNDPVLLADVDLEPSAIAKASEQTIDDIAVRVHAAATGVIAFLADYGLTATDLTTLDSAIAAYEAARAMPDAKRAERAGHTETLEPLFRDASLFLDGQLDVLMRRYKATDPTFHAGYEAARVIIDLHGPGEEDEPDPIP